MRIQTFVFAAVLGLAAAAQEPASFIEVLIIDTAKAPTTRIVYSCMVQPDLTAVYAENPTAYYGGGTAKEQKRFQEEVRKHQDSACMDQSGLNDQLRARGYRLVAPGRVGDKYSVQPAPSGDCSVGYNVGVQVELDSEAELLELAAYVRGLGNVTGFIVLWETTMADHDTRALERMYRMASEQAGGLARLSGHQLGMLLSATETSDERLRQLAYDMAEGLTHYVPSGHQTPDRRSMTFRFALGGAQ